MCVAADIAMMVALNACGGGEDEGYLGFTMQPRITSNFRTLCLKWLWKPLSYSLLKLPPLSPSLGSWILWWQFPRKGITVAPLQSTQPPHQQLTLGELDLLSSFPASIYLWPGSQGYWLPRSFGCTLLGSPVSSSFAFVEKIGVGLGTAVTHEPVDKAVSVEKQVLAYVDLQNNTCMHMNMHMLSRDTNMVQRELRWYCKPRLQLCLAPQAWVQWH